ncbi:Ig-like domain-containing protein [Rheinheimera soli]|uniref:Ig-like domain-containing protein n=1 Tax=Rheinheimera soli TaxID=443616 RepID=UPI001E3B63EC|nr:Ig-like domain-containing protein [Rheinheimera soli]
MNKITKVKKFGISLCFFCMTFVGMAQAATVTLNDVWLANNADDWQITGTMASTSTSVYLDVNTAAFNTPPVQFVISSISATAFNLDSISVKPFTNNDFQLEFLPNGSEVGKYTTTMISIQSGQTVVFNPGLQNITSFTIRFVDFGFPAPDGIFQEAPRNLDFLSFVTSPAVVAPSLSATAANPTFTENGSAVDLYSTVTANTNDSGQTFSGMTLTATNISNGASEILTIGGTDVALNNGNSGSLTGIGNYSVSVTAGTATVTVTGMTRTEAQMNTLINGITYRNTSDDPGSSSRVITLTSITDNGASNNSAAPNIASTVAVTPINDAPTLSATGGTPTYTENGSAVDLFSAVSISTVEAGQTISGLTMTITNLADGSSELLRVDGTDITLTNLTSGTSTGGNSVGYSVAVVDGTATVTLSGTLSTANAQTVVDGMSYRHSSDNPTSLPSRVVTLTAVTDSGGTANGGVNTTALSVSATVAITAVNDAPSTPVDSNVSANSVEENAANGTLVGITAVSTDPDSTVTYSLTDNAGGRFAIDSSTGVVTVANGSLLDYETSTSHNITVQASDGLLTASQSFSINILDVDDTGPAVTNISSSTNNGSYKADAVISIQITFNESVLVTGTPTLLLETGDVDRTATYSGGSPGATLSFSYTVQAGDNSLDLDYVSSASLSPNGGTLKDAATNDAVLTLPAPGSAGSLGANKTIVIDTLAPAAPSVPDLTAGSDSGNSQTDNITNVTTPTFTGTAEANSTVEVFAGATSLGTVAANGSGAWSWTVAGGSALADGNYSITATATDAAGNPSAASSGLSVTIDTAAPAKPAVPDLADASDTGSSNSDNLTNATSLMFNGTAEDGSTVSLSSSVNNALGTATATGGSWSLTTAAVTSEGAHNITLTATDLAGNISVASDPLAITLDKILPTIGGVAFDQGSVTSVNQAALSFTLAGAEVGATANYSISSSTGGTAVTNSFVVASAGQQVTGVNVSGLNDGTLTISLTLTDAAGNVSTPAVEATVNKDANDPIINSVAIASGNYKAGDTVSFSLTFSEALVLSGANSDYSLAIDIGGVTHPALLTNNAAGVLTFSYTVQAGDNTAVAGVAIANNTLSLLNGATIRDAGGNDAILSFTGTNNSAAKVDTTAPVMTVVTDPAQAVFVNAANYQIKGTHTEIGLTINLYTDTGNDGTADGGVLVSAIVDADGNWSLIQPLVADSAHNYVVTAEDAAGNTSVAVDVPTITEDSIAPFAPVVTTPAIATVVSGVVQQVTGTHAEDGVTIEVFVDTDNDGEADDSTVLASAEVGAVVTGTWSMDVILTANTDNNFVVIAKDKAANTSAAVDVPTITEDSVAPVVTIAPLATADSTPALAGTVDDTTATLSLVVNGQTYVPTNNGNGGWTLADNQIAALPHGVYDVVVTATDAQGNVGTDASSNELTIDLLSPSAYSVVIQQSRIDAANQTAMSFVFAGAEVGSTYTYVVSDGTNSVTNTGVVTAANQQIGSIDVTGLAEGTLQLSVILTDTAGNAGATATATVVKLYNSTPVISGSPATSVNEDSLYSFTPVATDADAGTTLTFSISNKPTWASFNTATGALTGTPTNNDVGTTSGIVISVSDGTATASLPAFAITVVNVNDAPVVTSTAITSATQGSPYSYSFTATDVDVGDTLTRSVVTAPAWLSFNAGTGVLSGIPVNSDVGAHAVTLRVTDAAGLFADQSFTVTVTNINDAPTITGTPAITVAQGAAYSFVPTAADVDVGTTLTFSIANKPTWANFNTATGALTGTPGNADVGATAGIVISVSDGELSAALPAFTLTVTNTNDAPTITGTPAITVAQGAAYSFVPTAADVDVGTTLTFSIANKPTWTSFNTATGALTGTPGNADVGATAGIVISVSDGELSAALPAFTLTVTNTNDAPTISGTPAITVAQGAAYSFVPTAADVDIGTTLTFSIANKPTWASFNTATGALTGTPGNADVGATAGIVISVSDGELSAALPAFTLTVTNTNDAPTITGTPAITVAQGAAYSFVPTATDVDIGTTLTFSIANKPTWASFNTATGALTGTPGNADVGATAGIVISVSDGELSAALPAFTLTVTNVNDAPTISGTPAITLAQGVAYSFVPTAADVDVGTTLTFSIANKPTWASFNTATGALTGTPGNADVGATTGIVISVSDGELSAALPAFTLTVTNVNDAPVISGTPATTVAQGAVYSFTPTATDVDPDTTFTFSIANKPSWASFNTATGALTGTPGNADVGATAGIVISVSDGELSAALPAFTLTVTNVNDAPVITSTAITSAIQDAVYSYSLTATDEDVGDTLTFSAATKPAWLSFNAATGLLSGTPARADVGSHQISLVVTDSGGLTATQNFSLVVVSSNEAPVATNRSATLEEDTSLSLTLTAQDPDQDELTFEIVTQPEHGTATLQGAVLVYTPEQDFNGTDSIDFIAKDAELSSNIATISLTVTAVNDNPVVLDDSYSQQRTNNNQYLLNVLANDTDVDGDTLTIDGASSSVGTVTFSAEGLIVTVPDRYVGPVSLRYTVTDGNGGRASANVSLIIEGGAAADLPVITVPADIEVNATALFTRVPLGTATAVDRNGRRLRVSLINGSLFFAPGEHIVYWQATDADGNTATAAQKVSVNPLISLSKDQLVTEGSDVVVEVMLNGPAPVYPLLVPYKVSGSADANDHTLVSGVAEITSGLSTSIRFTVLEDGQAEGVEDIIISLDASVNRGSQRSSRIVVTEANIAPVVSLTVQQNSESRLTVGENDGLVTVTATVTDANQQDQVSGVWSFGRLDNVTTDQTQLSFDPAEQGPGLYQVSYTATDNGTPNLSATNRVFIVVRPSLPALGSQDSDGDLIPDDQEGFADSDGDGIPDYLDAINECNVMPTETLGQTEFLVEGDPGVCLRLGTVAAETDAGGLQIAKDAIEEDPVAVNIGGIFDFIAYGLPEQGQSYSLVIPQRLPVPANAVYRKFSDVTGWVDFVSNERNSIASTQGERGFCPPPGGVEWTQGLTEGHWCVQVTVEDGGPNDADGIANSAIVDPGGVAVELNGNSLPVAVADQASTRVDTTVVVNVLANDSDPDEDNLTVSQAVGSFGTVTILADQQLSYTPDLDFIGTDTVIYNITDGRGGTASSELVVSVLSNAAPVAVDDVASTDDKTVVLIAVLLNDTDEDGNTLTVTSASAVQGSVSIEADQRLRYTPKRGFDGVDTISYTITDGAGGEATAQVSVTVRAYQDVVVDNKSSGGSMAWWMVMVVAGAVVLRRRSVLGLAAVALLSFSPFSQSADWYLQGSIGNSKADQNQSRLVEELPNGTITGFDDSDRSFGINLGYQLHPVFALELGYLDLGEASSQITAESLTPEQYHELVKAVSPVLVDGYTLAGRFTLWQNEQLSLEVPVGLLFWDSEIESRMNNTVIRSKNDGTDFYLGVQLNYQLAAGWKLGVGYQQLNLEPNDVNTWLVSLRYSF